LAPGNRKPMSGAMYRPALERRPSAGWGPPYRRDGPARSRTNFFLPTLSHLILNEPALPSGVPYSIQWSPEFGDLALDLLAFSFVANESHLEQRGIGVYGHQNPVVRPATESRYRRPLRFSLRRKAVTREMASRMSGSPPRCGSPQAFWFRTAH